MATSYSLLYHCWQFALKPLTEGGDFVDYPVTNGKMARGTDFEPNIEFETEDYEGHSGIKELVLQSDRVKVTAEPEYSHGVVFGECLEEYLYMITGSHDDVKDAATGIAPTEDPSGAYLWRFYQNLTNPKPLPRATLINQYSATCRDAVVFDNAMMNEFGVSMDDKGVNLSVKFMSDAPLMNQPNQTMQTVDLVKLGKEDVRIYIAPTNVTLTDLNKEQYVYDCVMSNEITFKTNLEESDCLNTPFGKNTSDEGKFETEGKAEIKWNPKAAFLEDEYYSGKAHGVSPTTEPLMKQILIESYGKTIATVSGEGEGDPDTEIKAMLSIHLPKVEITKCNTQYAGEDNKTLEIEYAHRQNGTVSPVEFKVVTPLDELCYGVEFTPDNSKVGSTTIAGVDINCDSS